MVLGKLVSDMQKNEAGPLLYTIHKKLLKWMKDLNTTPEIVKLLKEKQVITLLDTTAISSRFDTQTKVTKTKINK